MRYRHRLPCTETNIFQLLAHNNKTKCVLFASRHTPGQGKKGHQCQRKAIEKLKRCYSLLRWSAICYNSIWDAIATPCTYACNRISFADEKWDFLVCQTKINTMENTMDAHEWTVQSKTTPSKKKNQTHWKHIKISIKLLETIPFSQWFRFFCCCWWWLE